MTFLSILILANLKFVRTEITALQQRVDSTVYKCELWMHKGGDEFCSRSLSSLTTRSLYERSQCRPGRFYPKISLDLHATKRQNLQIQMENPKSFEWWYLASQRKRKMRNRRYSLAFWNIVTDIFISKLGQILETIFNRIFRLKNEIRRNFRTAEYVKIVQLTKISEIRTNSSDLQRALVLASFLWTTLHLTKIRRRRLEKQTTERENQ